MPENSVWEHQRLIQSLAGNTDAHNPEQLSCSMLWPVHVLLLVLNFV